MGSRKKPLIVRVQTEARALAVMQQCEQLGLHVIVGIEPDKPEDTADLERALRAAIITLNALMTRQTFESSIDDTP